MTSQWPRIALAASKHSLNLHILGPTKLENWSMRQMKKYEVHNLGRPACTAIKATTASSGGKMLKWEMYSINETQHGAEKCAWETG